MNIGCHISIAEGIFKAPQRATELGAECFQIFTRSPQGGKATQLTSEIIEKFSTEIKKNKLKNFVIHAPYYINFASKNNRIRYGSISAIRQELETGSLLKAQFVITHLGTTKDLGKELALQKTIEMLKKTLANYQGTTKLLLENSAGAGGIIGSDFQELAQIIKGVNNPSIAGICLDTQHSFASGYDWRDFKKTLKKIDAEIGLEKIKIIHANDSLTEYNSKKDRHAHIGKGLIGLEPFQKIITLAKEKDIDIILETSPDQVAEDILTLKKLRKNSS